MGYRLHVAKTYKVEYALGDAFNYKSEEVHNLMSACGIEYSDDEYDSDFEVSVNEWQKFIYKLKNLDTLDNENEKFEIEACIEDLSSSKEEVIKMLEYYQENGDTSDGYLHLSFF